MKTNYNKFGVMLFIFSVVLLSVFILEGALIVLGLKYNIFGINHLFFKIGRYLNVLCPIAWFLLSGITLLCVWNKNISKKYTLSSFGLLTIAGLLLFGGGYLLSSSILSKYHPFYLHEYGKFSCGNESNPKKWYVKNIKQTDTIPAVLNTWFGFTWLPFNRNHEPLLMKSVIIYPSQGRKDPVTGNIKYKDSSVFKLGKWKIGTVVYKFGSQIEMIPGTWTMQLWNQDKKVIEKKFYVFIPSAELKD